MEIVIIVAVAIGAIGWWIWKEGKHEEAGHPLENVTKNTAAVDPVIVTTVSEEITADRAVESESVAAVTKPKKAAAPKKEKKVAKITKTKEAPKKEKKVAAPKKSKK